MVWESVSVVTTAKPERVWQVYSAMSWAEWDHDIAGMRAADPAAAGLSLSDGAKAVITMAKDGKEHTATLSGVLAPAAFSYTAPLPGATMVATHTLELTENGGCAHRSEQRRQPALVG